jgi:polyphosphate kinase
VAGHRPENILQNTAAGARTIVVSMSVNPVFPVGTPEAVADLGTSSAAPARGLGAATIDRDLSWLEFNRRVLQEALDERTPLLERVKFLAIFSSNLDEFFMKRMALIRPAHGDDSLAAQEQRDLFLLVRERIIAMLEQESGCFSDALRPRLAEHGVHLLGWEQLTAEQQAEVSEVFDHRISPVLTPLSLDAAHPFPYVSNLSTSWAFRLGDPVSGESVLVRVKVPRELYQWLRVRPGVSSPERAFVGLDEVVAANAQKLFPGMIIENASQFRVCRDAEVELADNGLSKRDMVELELQQRRFEPVVRLELQPNADPAMVAELRSLFSLAPDDIYEMSALLDYTTLFEIAELPMPELRDPPWTPLPPLGLEQIDGDIFTAIRRGDVLIHQPYDSFDAGVERFIREAADDPQTLSIKMTVYRVGDDTPFVQSLIRAAEAGKQVACVIELNARFDEVRNLHWSRELEKVGAHVVFGLSGLKTHAKTALVVREEGDAVRCYAHVATGNYHSRTARLYEDVGLLTADPRVTDDVVTLFHFLTGRSRTPEFSTLVVAPMAMRAEFVRLIQREIDNQQAGRPARIVCKMNQLEDPEMCLLLSRASQAGVPVDLIVRGLSTLAPGVPGLTENIRIRSIIGRFLEHSRIFHFAAGAEDPLDGVFLIGSGDWMHRNLSERVETAVPILERRLRARLWEILEISLVDRRNAWEMQPDGSYAQLFPEEHDGISAEGTHAAMMRLALARHAV